MRPTALSSHKKRRQRGNALVEFAIGAGVLVMVFTGIFEFGYAFYVYNNLVAAVDNGAKYAAYRTYDSSTSTPTDTFVTTVKNMVVYGQPTTGSKPVAPALSTSHVTITPAFTNGVPSSMTVSLTGYRLDAVVTTLNLNKPVVTYQFMGVYAPAP